MLLIEADGSKRLPLESAGILGAGDSRLYRYCGGSGGTGLPGKNDRRDCSQAERTAEFLGKTPGDIIAAEDLIKIASSEEGLRKAWQTVSTGYI